MNRHLPSWLLFFLLMPFAAKDVLASFCPTKQPSRCHRRRSFGLRSNPRACACASFSSQMTQLSAVIYQPDGEKEYTDDDNDSPFCTSSSTGFSDLCEALSVPQHSSLLARLAVAFAPPSRPLRLPDVAHVAVASVDAIQVDLQAQVVDNKDEGGGGRGGGAVGDLVTALLVPVPLPTPLTSLFEQDLNTQTEQALQILQILDKQMEPRVRELTRQQEHEVELQRQWLDLVKEKRNDWPDWWQPGSGPLLEEATSLRIILNEDDFVQDLRALALRQNLDIQQQGEVERVAVVAIGPAGMVLRARVVANVNSTTRDDDDDIADAQLKEVPLPFDIKEVPLPFDIVAQEASVLRNTILDLVDEAETTSSVTTTDEPIVSAAAPIVAIDEDAVTLDNIVVDASSVRDDAQETEHDGAKEVVAVQQKEKDELILAAKYAAIKDVGKRAFQILVDLGMVQLHNAPVAEIGAVAEPPRS